MGGLFGRLAAGIETKSADVSALTWQALFGGPTARSGVAVNVNTSLKVTTVLACARVLAEGVAQLPFKIYQIGADGSKNPAIDNPVYKLIFRRPNDWMTAFEFRETMTIHAVLTRGAYALINRVRGVPKELLPLVPGYVRVLQDDQYRVFYEVRDAKGVVGVFPRGDVLHVHGPSWDSFSGMDPITLAREAIGLAIATEETHASLHANAAMPGGVLSIKGALSADARDRVKAAWKVFQEGVHNRFKTAVLDQDATWTPMNMTGVDSQHLETRKFQIEEICRALRVFPQMVGYSDKTATFASAESFFLAHVTHSLMPWCVRWEQAVERDLLDNADGLVAKFSLQALLRGDATTRANYYKAALGAGGSPPFMEINEIRDLEELNPVDWGRGQPAAASPVVQPPAEGKALEMKLGRVLSNANEKRIVSARDNLNEVLAALPPDTAP